MRKILNSLNELNGRLKITQESVGELEDKSTKLM